MIKCAGKRDRPCPPIADKLAGRADTQLVTTCSDSSVERRGEGEQEACGRLLESQYFYCIFPSMSQLTRN